MRKSYSTVFKVQFGWLQVEGEAVCVFEQCPRRQMQANHRSADEKDRFETEPDDKGVVGDMEEGQHSDQQVNGEDNGSHRHQDAALVADSEIVQISRGPQP